MENTVTLSQKDYDKLLIYKKEYDKLIELRKKKYPYYYHDYDGSYYAFSKDKFLKGYSQAYIDWNNKIIDSKKKIELKLKEVEAKYYYQVAEFLNLRDKVNKFNKLPFYKRIFKKI